MPASTSNLVRRSWYLIACLAPAWAVLAYVTGGIAFSIPLGLLIVGAIATAFYLRRYSRDASETDGRWLQTQLRRGAIVGTPIIILLGCAAGIYYGSFTAGGSDSYGYVSQASLWLRGSLRIAQPWVQQFSWPEREWTFAPLGYRPLSTDGTIVPTYAPGLPMIMALFQAVLGVNGPFWVVPVMGALAIWFTYMLGREVTGSSAAGTLAALLMLSCPVFLAHVMLPMTDVPVAAGWALVTLLALKQPGSRPFTAGLVAGATLLIRPNLVLLTLAPATVWRRRPAEILRFVIGLAPGVAAIAALNTYLYGSPLSSGYGGLGDLYGWSSAWPNLRHYSLWLIQTQTPLIAFALAPFAMRRALRDDIQTNACLCLGSLLALTLGSYIFYSPFDIWTYLRFLMPAYPAMFVLMAAGIRVTCLKIPLPVRAAVVILVCTFCVVSSVRFARDAFIFTSRDFEQRHIRAAEYVRQLTPDNAIILCVQHSGSLRYYAHRTTLRYDSLYEHRLDTTLRELKEKGYRPYIVVDDWEEAEFRKRFAARNRAGGLDWKPLVRVLTHPEVRIFDPEGRFE